MFRWTYVWLAALVLAFGVGRTSPANAVPIQVSQESSPGAGDFSANVLGIINSFSTGLSTAAFYQYGSPNNASYNGELNGGPNPLSNVSQLFLLSASDGLSLVVVHDKPNDGSGGSTSTRWNLLGDTAAQVLADDPGETVVVSGGGTQFDSTKNWIACCTDGYAIGSLDGNWSMLGQFLSLPTGINSWLAVSSDFSSIALTLESRRRVLLTPIPAPGAFGLFLLGLAGLGFAARRRLPTA